MAEMTLDEATVEAVLAEAARRCGVSPALAGMASNKNLHAARARRAAVLALSGRASDTALADRMGYRPISLGTVLMRARDEYAHSASFRELVAGIVERFDLGEAAVRPERPRVRMPGRRRDGRCAERGCPWPALAGRPWCRAHGVLHEGDREQVARLSPKAPKTGVVKL